jgi:hypothetical protein
MPEGRVGIRIRSVLLGLFLLVLLVACALGYAWLIYWPDTRSGQRSSDQLLLIFFTPFAAGPFIYTVFRVLRMLQNGLTRYTVGNALQIHRPLWTRVIRWSDVTDFELPPSRFPKPPKELVLILSSGRREFLPVRRFEQSGADVLLRERVPGLAEHGLDRVRRNTTRTISSWRVRWSLHAEDLVPLLFGCVFGIACVVAAIGWGWDYVNYVRLQYASVATQGTVSKVDADEDQSSESVCYATVRYTNSLGKHFKIHRRVPVSFVNARVPGTSVTVEYLPNHPSIARIRGWDLDGRMWAALLFIIPLIPIGFTSASRLLRWFQPLRDVIRWSVDANIPAIFLPGADIVALSIAFPGRHEGQLVLEPPRASAAHDKPSGWAWKRSLKKAGLSPRQLGNSFLLLSREDSARLIGRIGARTEFKVPYYVLDCIDTDHAAEFALSQIGQGVFTKLIESGDGRLRFFSKESVSGPFDAAQRRDAFERYLKTRLARLYGGALPRNTSYAEVARLFDIAPATRSIDVMLERRRANPRIWIHALEEPRAAYADCINGRWIVTANQPIPEALRRRTFVAKIGRLFMLPLLIPASVLALLVWPLIRWESRRHDQAIARDLAAMTPCAKDHAA